MDLDLAPPYFELFSVWQTGLFCLTMNAPKAFLSGAKTWTRDCQYLEFKLVEGHLKCVYIKFGGYFYFHSVTSLRYAECHTIAFLLIVVPQHWTAEQHLAPYCSWELVDTAKKTYLCTSCAWTQLQSSQDYFSQRLWRKNVEFERKGSQQQLKHEHTHRGEFQLAGIAAYTLSSSTDFWNESWFTGR